MDESSPNSQGINQEPAEENKNDYQQYLQPDVNNSQKHGKPIVFIGLGLLSLIVLISGLIFWLGRNKQPEQTLPAPAAVVCNDQTCFEDNFLQCSPATYTSEEELGTASYTITGDQGIGCPVSLKYIKAEDLAINGKEMTCDFDNGVEFRESLKLVNEHMEDYGCTGSLADYYLSIDNKINALYGL